MKLPYMLPSNSLSRFMASIFFVSMLPSMAFALTGAVSDASMPPHTGPSPSIHYGDQESSNHLSTSKNVLENDRIQAIHRSDTGTVGPLLGDANSVSTITDNVQAITTPPPHTFGPLHTTPVAGDNTNSLSEMNKVTNRVTGNGTVVPLSSVATNASQRSYGDQTTPRTEGTSTNAVIGANVTHNPDATTQKESAVATRTFTSSNRGSVSGKQNPTQGSDGPLANSTSPASSVVGTPSPTLPPAVMDGATADGNSGDQAGSIGIGLPPKIEDTIRNLVPDGLIPGAPWWWWLALAGVVLITCCVCCVCKCTRERRRRKAEDEKLEAELAQEAGGHKRHESRPQGLNFYHYDEESGCEDYEDSYPDTNYEDYEDSYSEFDHEFEENGREYSLTDYSSPYSPPHSPRYPRARQV